MNSFPHCSGVFIVDFAQVMQDECRLIWVTVFCSCKAKFYEITAVWAVFNGVESPVKHEAFYENSQRLNAVDYFSKALHLRCLKGF